MDVLGCAIKYIWRLNLSLIYSHGCRTSLSPHYSYPTPVLLLVRPTLKLG